MPLFMILLLAVAGISLFVARHASSRFATAMARGNKMPGPLPFTGAQMAERYWQFADIDDAKVVSHQGVVTDYFDPKRRRLFLSRRCTDSNSLAAWALALHEAAHASQTGDTLGQLKWRQSCIRLSRYLPTLTLILFIVLVALKVMPARIALLGFGALWLLTFLLNAGSLAVEWNANLRLRRFLERELANYPSSEEALQTLLKATATRELGDQLASPRYFFLSALPGTTTTRPRDPEPKDPNSPS